MPSPKDKRSGNTRRAAARPKTTTPSSDSSAPSDGPLPSTTPRRASTRRKKPSFDLTSDAAAAPSPAQAGWVYRSTPAAPAVAARAPRHERVVPARGPAARPAAATHGGGIAPSALDVLLLPF